MHFATYVSPSSHRSAIVAINMQLHNTSLFPSHNPNMSSHGRARRRFSLRKWRALCDFLFTTPDASLTSTKTEGGIMSSGISVDEISHRASRNAAFRPHLSARAEASVLARTIPCPLMDLPVSLAASTGHQPSSLANRGTGAKELPRCSSSDSGG